MLCVVKLFSIKDSKMGQEESLDLEEKEIESSHGGHSHRLGTPEKPEAHGP